MGDALRYSIGRLNYRPTYRAMYGIEFETEELAIFFFQVCSNHSAIARFVINGCSSRCSLLRYINRYTAPRFRRRDSQMRIRCHLGTKIRSRDLFEIANFVGGRVRSARKS